MSNSRIVHRPTSIDHRTRWPRLTGSDGRFSFSLLSLLFVMTLFLSAVLVFWLQPLMAKLMLPLLGGTPAVWNTCLLFFQSLLLAGYAYVVLVNRWLDVRRQILLHLVLLLIAAWVSFPFGISETAVQSLQAGSDPAGWLLWNLLSIVGLPFFVVSASAPLLQKWFSRTSHPAAHDPYFLYAASNAGSLAGLLAFPLLLEPNLPLGQHSQWWVGGYGALFVLIAACALALRRVNFIEEKSTGYAPQPGAEQSSNADEKDEALTFEKRVRLLLLAAVPSSLVLGVTTYLTTDIASLPLLWVIPLALYLLTFILAFAQGHLRARRLLVRTLPLAALMVTLVYLSGATEPEWFLMLVHLIFFFVAALACHGQLADRRPSAKYLPEFYLWLAVGGALGGFFNALAAPLLFDRVIEYPLAMLLACVLALPPAPAREESDGSEKNAAHSSAGSAKMLGIDFLLALTTGVLMVGLAWLVKYIEIGLLEKIALVVGLPLLLIKLFLTRRPAGFAMALGAMMLASNAFPNEGAGQTLHRDRNFYGTLRVTLDAPGTSRKLYHGSTIHGRQFVDPTRACEPLSYYHRAGPLGSVFKVFTLQPRATRVAIVGLGTGATAAYAQTGQQWTFYEINPAVLRLARDEKFFSYLPNCVAPGANVEIVLGDARWQLQRHAPEKHYDLIVLDAFSSDAIPMHLLTREALALYLSKLSDEGWLAVHISNRSLNLRPVIAALAKQANLSALAFNDTPGDATQGREASEWVALARRAVDLAPLGADNRWQPLDLHTTARVWSDDFSDIFSVFKGW